MTRRAARAWAPAALAAAAIALWWMAEIRYAYQGQATALYMIGERTPMPRWLEEREPPYRWRGSGGYDGQYFHLLAHAPFDLRGLAPLMDRPRMRCQRILVPLASWILAGGRFEWIDPAYFMVILAAVAAGVWWTAQLAVHHGASPWWGLAFLALPSSLGSVERMLVDGPLLAVLAGFVLFLETGSWRAAWLLAAAAPLVRETGLVIPAAAALVFASRKLWMKAALWSAAAAPFFLWLFLIRDLPGSGPLDWAGAFHSIRQLVTESEPFARYPRYRLWLQALDLAALAGFLAACGASLRGFWISWTRQERLCPALAAAALSAGAALALCHFEPRHGWDSVFSLGRVFAPVYFGLLIRGIASGGPWPAMWFLAPAAVRAALPLGPVAWRIVAHAAGG